MTNNNIVQKLWNLCDVLRDDGINYSDYVTELVLLLFIKMVDEYTKNEIEVKHPLPEGCRWSDLKGKDGLTLLNDYKRILLSLSTGKDGLGKDVHEDTLIQAIYADAQTRLREPRHLKQLVDNLDDLDWFTILEDGLGDLYEGLLEKNANETKSGAGQYFTPRALIDSMVRCVNPQPGETIQDPAAGTAGFLIAADTYMKDQTSDYNKLIEGSTAFKKPSDQKKFQKYKAFVGIELVPNTRRLALMNGLLHGMEGGDEGVVHLGNALGGIGENLPKADIILANPPFGTSKGGEASITRQDLTYKTSNKQLAFLQHIYRGLKPGGRAAVVLPDNVLFEAGIGSDIRKDFMNKCQLHAILRLPTGIFYAAGVKTNVLFFTKGSATDENAVENATTHTWVYDLRTNMPSFGKRTPFGKQHLAPFENVFTTLQAKNWAQPARTEKSKTPKTEIESQEWLAQTVSQTTAQTVKGKTTQKDVFSLADFALCEEGTERTLETSRLQCFSREHIRNEKSDSLDISWLKDKDSIDAADLPEPDVLAAEAMTELTEALRLMTALGATDQANIQKDILAGALGLADEVSEEQGAN
jgi:type I restriction enzyme M protein